jgi:uncharacterized cupin superfamily protein
MRLLTSKYREFALGARTFIHSGRRGRSATGRDRSITISLESVVPEAHLDTTETGSAPTGEGWFVLSARDAQWFESDGMGLYTSFESEATRVADLGVGLGILRPGEPNCMYHGEGAQEDFLVLFGECLLIVEGEERLLRQWDFVHCPAWTEHVFVGAGDGPCVVVAVGARLKGRGVRYVVNETALRYGAGVDEETSEPSIAYARFAEDKPISCPEDFPPG